jgi:hypothetical protein
MKSEFYESVVEGMEPLSTFPVETFLADDETPQCVCEFMLALALVYNDLRDLWIMRMLVFEGKVSPEPPTPALGEYAGRLIREIRLAAGMLEELFDLIRKNPDAVEHTAFKRFAMKMTKEARADWLTIVSAAKQKKTPRRESLALSIARIRNDIGYHYQPAFIGEAFRRRFVGATGTKVPFVSMGTNLKGTRFYFGDAAAEEYLLKFNESAAAREALMDPRVILERVAHALFGLLWHFINSRGGLEVWSAPLTDGSAGAVGRRAAMGRKEPF